MDFFTIVFLSVLQGLGEFIPISSSGHLIIFSFFLNNDFSTKELNAFIVFLHLGTLTALLIYQRKTIFKILGDFMSELKSRNSIINSTLFKVGLASIPALAFGFFYSKFVQETLSRETVFVMTCLALMTTGTIFIVSSRYYKNKNKLLLSELSIKKSFFIGLFQMVPVISGFSRSGTTITGSRLVGLDNKESIEFSFLMSIPVIAAATAYSILESYEFLFDPSVIGLNLIGMIISGIVGYFAISFLFRFLKNRGLELFGAYCFLFGFISILIYFIA